MVSSIKFKVLGLGLAPPTFFGPFQDYAPIQLTRTFICGVMLHKSSCHKPYEEEVGVYTDKCGY